MYEWLKHQLPQRSKLANLLSQNIMLIIMEYGGKYDNVRVITMLTNEGLMSEARKRKRQRCTNGYTRSPLQSIASLIQHRFHYRTDSPATIFRCVLKQYLCANCDRANTNLFLCGRCQMSLMIHRKIQFFALY